MEKQYKHSHHEQQAQALWQAENVYHHQQHPGKIFSIDTPPPTVSGSLHIGHIFSYTQTDIIARYKRMSGFSVFYPFGFDDNGLATERFVEKKHNVQAHVLGRTAFNKLCLEETRHTGQLFRSLWERIGLSVDWNACYSTISAPVQRIAQESFIRLFNQQFIYRKREVAPYCTACRTAIAQAELDDAQKGSTFYDIAFKSVTDNKELVIATTRPELLPACVALFYHPNDSRYQQLHNTKAIVPLFGHQVPILPDEAVDKDKGTGLVMCCAFGDKKDVQWIKQHQLPDTTIIDRGGRLTAQAGQFAGLTVSQARTAVVQELEQQGFVRANRAITHTVNVHERCKKEVELLALEQWFLNIIDHKDNFINAGNTIAWHPLFMKARYTNWVENIGWDWCLSRQRFFGIPFPAWHCQGCSAILLADINTLPIDPQEQPYPGKTCPHCTSNDIVPDTDVMDTWNTSSLTPYIVYTLYNKTAASPFTDAGIADFLPMSMRPQAHDIIRTWAFYTIAKTTLHHETKPWHDIVISGHVLSDNKEKLSKSKDQKKTDPLSLLATYPADVIRYWTTGATLGHDVMFSEQQFSIGQRLLTKLWNAFYFIREHTQQQSLNRNLQPQDVTNQWVLHQLTCTLNDYKQQFEQYEFKLALEQIDAFFWQIFCDNYLELIKDKLFNPASYATSDVEETRDVLYAVGLYILQLYAPYIPHITETLYQELYKRDNMPASLHLTKFTTIQQYENGQSTQVMDKIVHLIGQVRKLKTTAQLSLKTEVATLIIHAPDATMQTTLQQQEKLLKGICRAQQVRYETTPLEQPILEQEPTLTMHITL